MNLNKKYSLELPSLEKEFNLSFFMYKIKGIYYILPQYIIIDTTFSQIICRLLFQNKILGDIYQLSVSSGNMTKNDKIFKKYIYPILSDYSNKNQIDLTFDFEQI